MNIVGYSNHFSVKPGRTMRFMVSSRLSTYHAALVRLRHTDTNPTGPGFKTDPIESSFTGDYPGHEQAIYPGSYVEVPADHSLALSDGFTLQLPYRYSVYEDKIKQRFGIGCSYKYSFKPMSLKYRTRFQRTFEKNKTPENLIRNKCTIEYKLDKNLEPYISSELFHFYNEPVQLDEYRLSFGLTVDIMKKNSIKIFYIFKKEDLTKSDPYEVNVFGLAYSFKM